MFGIKRSAQEDLHLLDINDPTHTNGIREAKWGFFLVTMAGFIFWTAVDVSWLPLFFKIFVTLLLATGLGYALLRWIGGKKSNGANKGSVIDKDHYEAEVRFQNAEAMTPAKFDSFE